MRAHNNNNNGTITVFTLRPREHLGRSLLTRGGSRVSRTYFAENYDTQAARKEIGIRGGREIADEGVVKKGKFRARDRAR